MLDTLTHHPASTEWPGLLTRSAVLLVLILGCGPAARGHEPEPIVDVSRYFGPIDPRLDQAGDTVAFSYQGALWRMPREGGVMTRLTAGAGFGVAAVGGPGGTRVGLVASGHVS